MAQCYFYQFSVLLALFQSPSSGHHLDWTAQRQTVPVTASYPSLSQRRIKDGKEVISNKKYVVYLLGAASAPHVYHGWLCGGAILNKDYVITSAACVQDVQHIYVVAGYNKYVSADNMDDDKCVNEKKKKVVLTCVPRNYQFEYNRTEVWAKVDIAVIKVESSFDFNDKSYETLCSYTPEPIDFNTERDFPRPGDDVIAMGWGHRKEFRKDSELIDMNQATLQYAPTRLMDEEDCARHFEGNQQLASLIKSSMLCTLEIGNLNDKGELILRSPPVVEGCITKIARLRGAVGPLCEGETVPEVIIYEDTIDVPDSYYYDEVAIVSETRRKHGKHIKRRQKTSRNDNESYVIDKELLEMNYDYDDFIRAQEEVPIEEEVVDTPGICQNDHGGPLIAWRGGREVLVAVATLFKLDNKRQCIGPYLFTKTWCNGAFLSCILEQDKPSVTARRCDVPEEIGFEIIRRQISWVGHRDGPADNEHIKIRPQIPMSAFQPNISQVAQLLSKHTNSSKNID